MSLLFLYISPLQVLECCTEVLLESSPSWTSPPPPNLLSWTKCSGLLIILMTLLWTCSNSCTNSSCWCGPRPRHITPSGASQRQTREGQLPPSPSWPLLLWWSSRYCWPSRLQQHTSGSCPAFCKSRWLSPALQVCSQQILLACTYVWDCPIPSAAPCTWPR